MNKRILTILLLTLALGGCGPIKEPPRGEFKLPSVGDYVIRLQAFDADSVEVPRLVRCSIAGYAADNSVVEITDPKTKITSYYRIGLTDLVTPTKLNLLKDPVVHHIEFVCTMTGRVGDEFTCTITSRTGEPVNFTGNDRDVIVGTDPVRIAICQGSIFI